MSRIRTFIAVGLNKAIRDRCVAMQQTLGQADAAEVNWVTPESMHVTLLFLGDVDDRDLPAVCLAVNKVCEPFESFALSVQGVGCFPNTRRPRVVWAGLGAGAEELKAIHVALEGPLLELGCYRREDRQYTPHITLGRLRQEPQSEALAKLIGRQADWVAGETEVNEVHVMSSDLTPQGPVYAVLSRARLARE